ncbi:MAG: hypothetical protein IT221_09255 [Fluviicola sp.]|nr:hypothetical protein [Fluviicola sp.]
MEQKDYLTRQIEQMALVLSKLIGRLLNDDDTPSIDFEESTSFQELETELNIDFHALIALSNDAFLDKLLNEHHFTTAHFESLAEVFYLMLTKKESNNQKLLIEKALLIYAYLEKKEAIYSTSRQQKIETLERLSQNNS